MPDLEQARELVKAGDYEMLSLLYGNVPEVLAQLVRTAFIPAPGNKFIVADFSAIEARVLSFLAGERWRMEVFESGGDIYCASASQMFGVPVEKHGTNGELRQKGKQAELACIAEGSLVLTDKGLVPIENVKTDHLLWDGETWVKHDGVIYKGEREVITHEGLTATEDHLVWVDGESEPIQFGVAAASGAHLVQTGDGGTAIRLGKNYQSGKEMEQDLEPLLCADRVSGMWKRTMAAARQFTIRQVKRLSALLKAKADTNMARPEVDGSETKMRESKRSPVSKLWRKGNPIQFSFSDSGWIVYFADVWRTFTKSGTGSYRKQWKLRKRKSEICLQSCQLHEQEKYSSWKIRAGLLALFGKCSPKETVGRKKPRADHSGCREGCTGKEKMLAAHKRTARLYDIQNAGRHHRFTVSGRLVHNCGYGGSVGALKAMGAIEAGMKEEELQPLVDAWRSANPHIVQYWQKIDFAVKKAVKERVNSKVDCVEVYYKSGMLFIQLPSGRTLAYVKPQIGTNRFGGESVTYMGIDSTKHWSRIESFPGRWVENIVQAVSRDILAYAMQNLSSFRIVAHVHDEVIIECPPDTSVQEICDKMGQTPPCITGLSLRADGYECTFYKKD